MSAYRISTSEEAAPVNGAYCTLMSTPATRAAQDVKNNPIRTSCLAWKASKRACAFSMIIYDAHDSASFPLVCLRNPLKELVSRQQQLSHPPPASCSSLAALILNS